MCLDWILDANFPALVEDRRETGDQSPRRGNAAAGASVDFSGLVGLECSFLQCQILLQQGPQGKGSVNNLM